MQNMDEKELIRSAKFNDQDAIQELIRRNEGIIFKLAKELVITCESLEIEDLYQEGVIGLIKAIERYSPDYESRFSTYVYKCIKGSMLNAMKHQDRLIRYPKSLIEKIEIINKKLKLLNQKLSRKASFNEILENTDITYEELNKYLILIQKVARLEDIKFGYYESEDNECLDIIYDLKEDFDVEETAINNILVNKIFSSYFLSDVEKQVLYLMYYEQLSLAESGEKIGYTKEGVRIIKNRAKSKILKQFKGWT